MGMLLSCAREALPGGGAAFVIATVEATVSAVSEAAEPVFGVEQSILGTPVADLLGSPMGEDRLLRTVTQAATRAREPEVMPVRGLTAERRGPGHDGRADLDLRAPARRADHGRAQRLRPPVAAESPAKTPALFAPKRCNRHKPLKCCAASAEKLCSQGPRFACALASL